MSNIIPFTREERKLKVVYAERRLEDASRSSYLWNEDHASPLAILRYEATVQKLEDEVEVSEKELQYFCEGCVCNSCGEYQ